jgi:hypothetical protein
MASNRVTITSQVVINSIPTEITLIQNPTIDDVLIGEARVQATSIETTNPGLVTGRVVPLAIRDFLIRLGVER